MPGFDNGVVFAENVDFSGAFVNKGTASMVADGQLLIGSTAAPNIRVSTLSAGVGLSITNGAGSITLSTTGSIINQWLEKTTSFNAVAGTGYFCSAALTATLPAFPSQGDTISFLCQGSSAVIQANTGQVIEIGSNAALILGTATSNNIWGSLTLVFRSSGTSWYATSVIGSWTLS